MRAALDQGNGNCLRAVLDQEGALSSLTPAAAPADARHCPAQKAQIDRYMDLNKVRYSDRGRLWLNHRLNQVSGLGSRDLLLLINSLLVAITNHHV
ncbi:MAG: hypothetical protein QGH82_02900 [Candidatus Woesearchaeota archaeon]|nr:hypothetical protein [Candidatus Woesearchaeota archaeon]